MNRSRNALQLIKETVPWLRVWLWSPFINILVFANLVSSQLLTVIVHVKADIPRF